MLMSFISSTVGAAQPYRLIDEGWHFWAGVCLLISFLPMTAFSYRLIRLPEKEKQYQRIMERLTSRKIEDGNTFTILDEKYGFLDYAPPLVLVSLFSFTAFSLLFGDQGAILLRGAEFYLDPAGNYSVPRAGLLSILMAFLGAYVWSLQYIFRRLVVVDLPPGAYYSVGTRMILSSFVALVFSHFISYMPSGQYVTESMNIDLLPDHSMRELLPVIAFLIGFFPQRALHYLAERFRFSSGSGDESENLSLDILEGISPYHKMRLAELSIDNIQNLVKASLVELLLKTPFKPRQVIDWMAQGRLCLQFKHDTAKLRRSGVRTILGFKKVGDKGKLPALAAVSGLMPEHLETVYLIIRDNHAIDNLSKAKDCLHTI